MNYTLSTPTIHSQRALLWVWTWSSPWTGYLVPTLDPMYLLCYAVQLLPRSEQP